METKDTVIVRRKDILKEMALKFGIYEDFDINDFLGIAANALLDTDDIDSPYHGYEFKVVDDTYEFTKLDLVFERKLFTKSEPEILTDGIDLN